MRLLVCAAVALYAAGCARVQRLKISTNPEGAEVLLIKRGRLESRAGVSGIGGLSTAQEYEDAPISLGTSPLSYEFRIVEDQNGVHIAGFHAGQRKVCTQVVIKAKRHTHYAERLIPVSDDVADVNMLLTDQGPPAAAPQAMPSN